MIKDSRCCEVESILNNRLITKVSDDPKDLEAITSKPIVLLTGEPILPPGLFEKRDLYIKKMEVCPKTVPASVNYDLSLVI